MKLDETRAFTPFLLLPLLQKKIFSKPTTLIFFNPWSVVCYSVFLSLRWTDKPLKLISKKTDKQALGKKHLNDLI